MNADLPAKITKELKSKLYFKFIVILILNNIFITLVFNIDSDEIEKEKFIIPKNYTQLIIKAKNKIAKSSYLAQFAIINPKGEILVRDALVIDLFSSELDISSYVVSVNTKELHKLIPYIDQALGLLPSQGLRKNTSSPKGVRYEVSF